ncbi:MAG: ATP-dependent DNA helicase [Tissierellia bacterium]|nr:ATP-dependent DNA helicase [Tissierellia bacterium]
MKEILRLSVRQVVRQVLRSGHIDSRFLSKRRAREGVLLHQKLQKAYGPAFQSEVPLRWERELDQVHLVLEGRCDGLKKEGDHYLIDEIKSTLLSQEEVLKNPNPLHWAQVKFYGYMVCADKGLDQVTLRLSYIQVDTEEVFYLHEDWSRKGLEDFFFSQLEKYLDIQREVLAFRDLALASMGDLAFPFKKPRPGQRDLAVAVYNMIQQKDTLLAQAPTGIGKTLATLFPSIKALNQGLIRGIFYATARSTQKDNAAKTHRLLAGQGLRLKTLVLSSKEKACLNDQLACNPRDCPYARGHFDRVGPALKTLYKTRDLFDQGTLAQTGEDHQVCPYYMQMDLAPYCQLIIGDYNYVFHPQMSLEETLDQNFKDFILLVDEAHNLVDRGRDMYSLCLGPEPIQALLKEEGLKPALRSRLEDLLIQMDLVLTPTMTTYPQMPETMTDALEDLLGHMDRVLARTQEEPSQSFMDLYFLLYAHRDLLASYDPQDFIVYSPPKEDRIYTLCLNPGRVLGLKQASFSQAVFFSATLEPMAYHAQLLGTPKNTHYFRIPSPFDPSHFKVLIDPQIKTSYRHRQDSLDQVATYIKAFCQAKRGNYLFFFPSYNYLQEVYQVTKAWDKKALVQERNMSEKDREAFLNHFLQDQEVHGYAVMGGVFSEAIDLPGQALLGAVVVSMALPGLSPERNLIKDLFYQRGQNGYDYAYKIPGIIKVLQSAGRIIRKADDRGALLLVDQRFLEPDVRALLPGTWDLDLFYNQDQLQDKLRAFWSQPPPKSPPWT